VPSSKQEQAITYGPPIHLAGQHPLYPCPLCGAVAWDRDIHDTAHEVTARGK